MQNNNVIEVDNIVKTFKVFYDRGKSLKELLVTKGRRKHETRKVLKGISFTVKKGEAIGLIGKNGCGKSTTLKLLTKIIYPDSGTINMKGRVSSLLELGAGFHPDMSGRENIYLNASIFGLTRKEIDTRVDAIIAFSELEEYIENPVRTYSSGMYMRLAFAVAINVNADILLVDEILAVGDVSFQTKCFEKLKEIKAKGTTIVIVSHAMGQIEQICDRAIWIDEGVIKEEGIPKFVGEHYLATMENNRLAKIEVEYNKKKSEQQELDSVEKAKYADKMELPLFCGPRAVRTGNRMVEFTDLSMFDINGKETRVFKTHEEIIINMSFSSPINSKKISFSVSFSSDDGTYIYGSNTYKEFDYLLDTDIANNIILRIKNNALLPGKYLLNIGMYTRDDIDCDVIWNVAEFQVMSEKNRDFGICRLEHFWEVNSTILK
ncbi:ABC transporter ATP-binding protein [Lacrimispora sp.]|uniref:ABC transporter ATP-binding protein n=1 Tax=Lacrimispora sp. TaxID=2719234 RepID=UPI00286511F5|nr:ABC transporter ATP-binding protein [Lacrimispora sp.]MDR7814998.1 ABC transporter ATP-binding protein [Lacrimispora sp.]